MMRIILLLLSLAFIAGCGDSGDDSREDTVGKEIADDFNKAMDKASDVEEQLQEAKDNIDNALEDAGEAIEEVEDGVKD